MSEPRALIALADSRMKDQLADRSIRSARKWEQFVTGLSDHELVGLHAQCAKQINRRGLDTK